MKFLVFDTILNGHHSDYITCLIEYWCNNTMPGELIVVTPRGLGASLPADYTASTRLTLIELTDQELRQAQQASRISRAFAEWNLFVRYAEKIRPDHAVLMYFDLFQLGVWLGKKSPCPVSGIYFRPSFHYTSPDTAPTSFREKSVILRKKWVLKGVLTSSALTNLFCLDKSSVPAIQAMTNRVRVVPLSDPVKRYDVTAAEVKALRMSLGVEDHRTVFLLFGYLDDRKGIEPMLDAIRCLPEEESARLTLVLAGPITEAYQKTVEDHLSSMNSSAQIVRYFKEIKGTAIQLLFEMSDFVLTLYQKHVGMSSIMVRAALSQKPLISSDFGYMGSLVKAEKLGMTVNSESAESISRALRQALRGEITYSTAAMQKLAEQNTSLTFAQQIFGTITPDKTPSTP
ncbi:glycosyltransferase [Telluribacter sp.]|jgi:glycosyltransferase involved in cell wall biosynthesis|uniref:glycosyltransferase n=1 Tax=Telluribacter sp. TaxID=1978767 RepID=UPI002E13FBC2|nr:glycosyltransferase [Telluribacter sp.]